MAKTTYQRITRTLSLLPSLGVTLLFLYLPLAVKAQTSAMDGKTPSGLTPGAPAGSYALSGFENVNLFNGNLNFSLPLPNIGGRGGLIRG